MRRPPSLSALRPAALLLVLLLGHLPGVAHATRPRLWRQFAFDDFAQGEAAGVSVRREGGLVLARALTELDTLDVQRIWSLAQGPDGTLYVGTGDEGQVWAVARDGHARMLLDSPEVAIHSLLCAAGGRLYAGTAPDGLVYSIDVQSGAATTLCRTGSHYVWDLLEDGNGGLLAATGDPGLVLTIAGNGQVQTYYDPSQRHVMCLARLAGRLYAGTAQEARIFALDGKGAARLLHAPPQAEIRNLGAGPDSALYSGAIPEAQTTVPDSAAAAVYRITGNGAVSTVWRADGKGLLGMGDGNGAAVVLAAGDPASLLQVNPAGGAQLLQTVKDLQPSCLLQGRDGVLFIGSGQSGRIVRMGPEQRREGHFDSAVQDFGAHARWGRLTWRADGPQGTQVQLQTRSGNSPKPDATWSPWSEPLGQSGQNVVSPPARDLQYRAVLGSDDPARTPVVQEVDIVGQQTNVPPQITALDVAPYRLRQRNAEGAQETAAGNAAIGADPRRPPHARSLHLVRWQAADANGDELTYALDLKGAGQSTWKRLADDVTQTTLLWDTGLMPEGLTVLRLVASDGSENAAAEALQDERLSAPFVIDNTPPQVEASGRVDGRSASIQVRARDVVTTVSRLQYSMDYHDKVTQIGAADGLLDSPQEEAGFTVDDLLPGEHVIVVQAADELDNVGVAQVVVEIR